MSAKNKQPMDGVLRFDKVDRRDTETDLRFDASKVRIVNRSGKRRRPFFTKIKPKKVPS